MYKDKLPITNTSNSKFRRGGLSRKIRSIQQKIEIEKQKLAQEKEAEKILEEPKSAECSVDKSIPSFNSSKPVDVVKED